jgi:hypothetical protein
MLDSFSCRETQGVSSIHDGTVNNKDRITGQRDSSANAGEQLALKPLRFLERWAGFSGLADRPQLPLRREVGH